MSSQLPRGPYDPVPFDEVLVLDTETTGLAPFGRGDDGAPTGDPHGPDRLCALAFHRLRRTPAGWAPVESLSWTFDPERPIPDVAAQVNGFTWVPGAAAMVEGRRNLACGEAPFSVLADEILASIGDCPVVCHNNAFDIAVFDAELVRHGRPAMANPVLCTKKAFSDLLGQGRPNTYVPGTSLNKLCDRLGIDRASRQTADGSELHGALVDAGLAAECFMVLDATGWMVVEHPASLPHRDLAEVKFHTPAVAGITPVELWAFATGIEDVALRHAVRRGGLAFGATCRLLAEHFPAGSAKQEILRRFHSTTDHGEKTMNLDAVVAALAGEMVGCPAPAQDGPGLGAALQRQMDLANVELAARPQWQQDAIRADVAATRRAGEEE